MAGAGYRIDTGLRDKPVDRAPGLSVRLKLTLSYAGFLMVAGALLLAVVWVFLLRYVPDRDAFAVPGPFSPTRSDLLDAFAPKAAIALGVLLVLGVLGGWILAGEILTPLTRITDATRLAATGSLSHRILLHGRRDEFRELADAFDAMLAQLEAHVAEQQRFAANASHELRTPLAVTQTLLDVARKDPHRDNGELVERLHAVNTRAIDLTGALLLLSRADQRSFAREHVDLSLIAEEATETLLPLAEQRGLTIETSGDMTPTIGSHALLLQLTTNLVHNAIVHNLPEQGTVWVTTSRSPRECGAHGREHRREAHPTVGVHAWRAVSSRYRTYTHRPRGCRPRAGDRQEHRPSTRRNPHPHAPARWGALRHGATPRRAAARRRVTSRDICRASADRPIPGSGARWRMTIGEGCGWPHSDGSGSRTIRSGSSVQHEAERTGSPRPPPSPRTAGPDVARRSAPDDSFPRPPRRPRLSPPRPHGAGLDRCDDRDHRGRLRAGGRVQRRLRHARIGVQGGERPHQGALRRLLRRQEIYVVWKDPAGAQQPGRRSERVDAFFAEAKKVDHVAEETPIRVSRDGTIGATTLPLTVPGWDVPKEDGEKLIAAAEANSGDGLQIKLGGDPIYAAQETTSPEGLGFLGAAIVLLIAFGSVVAAGLPLVIALVGLGHHLGRPDRPARQRRRRARLDDRRVRA